MMPNYSALVSAIIRKTKADDGTMIWTSGNILLIKGWGSMYPDTDSKNTIQDW
jgi:hypothetical protein